MTDTYTPPLCKNCGIFASTPEGYREDQDGLCDGCYDHREMQRHFAAKKAERAKWTACERHHFANRQDNRGMPVYCLHKAGAGWNQGVAYICIHCGASYCSLKEELHFL